MSHQRSGYQGSQQPERRKLQRYLCSDAFINCQVRLLLTRCACEKDDAPDSYGRPIVITPTNFNHQGFGFFHHEPVDISRFADTDHRRQAPHALFDFDFQWSPGPELAAVGVIEVRDLPAQFVYVTDSDVGTNYGLKFVIEQTASSTQNSASDKSQALARTQANLLTIEKALVRSSSLDRYNLD